MCDLLQIFPHQTLLPSLKKIKNKPSHFTFHLKKIFQYVNNWVLFLFSLFTENNNIKLVLILKTTVDVFYKLTILPWICFFFNFFKDSFKERLSELLMITAKCNKLSCHHDSQNELNDSGVSKSHDFVWCNKIYKDLLVQS